MVFVECSRNTRANKQYPVDIPAGKCELGGWSRHNVDSHVVGHVTELDTDLTVSQRAGLKPQSMYVEARRLSIQHGSKSVLF